MSEVLDLLWGADEIGKAIRRNRRQTYRLLESGAIPASKINGTWIASKSQIERVLQQMVTDGMKSVRHGRDIELKT